MRLETLESGTRHHGLRVGSEAPEFSLPTLNGKLRSLRDLLESAPALQPILITGGATDTNRAVFKEHGLEAVRWDRQRQVAQSYHAHGTPGAVMVSRAGRIASATVLGGPAINRLVLEAVDAAEITDLDDARDHRTPATLLAAKIVAPSTRLSETRRRCTE